MEGQPGDSHSGELKRKSADARAEWIIAEEMARLGWSKEKLAQKAKSDPGKLAIAARPGTESNPSVTTGSSEQAPSPPQDPQEERPGERRIGLYF